MRYYGKLCTALLCSFFSLTASAASSHVWQFDDHYIGVNALTDNITQIRIEPGKPSADEPFPRSIMIDPAFEPKQVETQLEENAFLTTSVSLTADESGNCVSITDNLRETELTKLCINITKRRPKLKLSKNDITHVYGLGEQFIDHGNTDGDWIALEERYPGNAYGNEQTFLGLDGGKTSNAEFPVMFAVGPNDLNYALIIDSHYPNFWNFKKDPWKVSLRNKDLKIILITGKNLPELRTQYMQLVGTPPVPPKKMFGLWVSEYGYETWNEVNSNLKKLRKHNFPLDGFVLDLQWFGGKTQSPDTKMGSYTWDEDNFPEPEDTISQYAEQGIGLVAIEEPYIGQRLPTFDTFSKQQFLVSEMKDRKCTTDSYDPLILDAWWGVGGMADFTNPHFNVYLHDEIRIPNMISKGLIGHWTDLGEPETYNAESCYHGFSDERANLKHTSIHNFYNLYWSKGIYEGYVRHNADINQRPFIMSRSGTIGSQRYGVSMWSGDIGSDLKSLRTQHNAQMHISLSGIDYFGSDIGGFIRMGGHHIQMNSYTQWMANSTWTDVPVRPHTYNVDNIFSTNPADMGNVASNLQNIRERYRWAPYYYSLAYRAYLYGEPLVPPAFYYFQNDETLAGSGKYKMIGEHVLIRTVVQKRPISVDMYLPEGSWYNYRTNQFHASAGEKIDNQDIKDEKKIITIPVFVKAGAIIPQTTIEDESTDIMGRKPDGSISSYERVVKIYPGSDISSFTLYEDDGTTVGFDDRGKPKYETRTTQYNQHATDEALLFTANASVGTYKNAPDTANYKIMFAVPDKSIESVSVNDISIGKVKTLVPEKSFEGLSSGWFINEKNELWIKHGDQDVTKTINVRVLLKKK